MNPNYLSLLRCPKSNHSLVLKDEVVVNGRIKEGSLVDPLSGTRYPIVNFIPRFVPLENYASGFGFQWNKHFRTQYDDTSSYNTSKYRFEKETKWSNNLTGQFVLEAGSGSGRFTTEALKTGAIVVSFDYSNAVEANYKSNGYHENLVLVQASIFEIPFEKARFDKAFCFGVLQHTPDPEGAFLNLPRYLKAGGKLASDVYVKNLTKWVLQPKYWVRPFTKGKDPEKLYSRIVKYVDIMWPLARLIRKIPKIGPSINWKLILPDYSRELPNASDVTLKEWTYLDAMDMLSPMYDLPQTLQTFREWHQKAGLVDIDVHYGFNGIEGRGTKV
ncbi:MAG: methyltransferase domain-containing protein [Cyclobacteriaceae bacterium]|nr:methyltransferase domain-containing protein [Cyclobacteriaceae bacterium]